MGNPFRSWKFLPWKDLFQAAFLTVLIVILGDFGLFLVQPIPAIAQLLERLFTPPFGIIVGLAIAVGIGALAVTLLQRVCARVNNDSLWGLILCIALIFLVRRWLPPPAILFQIESSTHVVGLVIGIFWKGKSDWRW